MKENDVIKSLQQQIGFYNDIKAYRQLYEMLFIKLWSIRSRLHNIDNPAVYLHTITKNFSLNYITHRYKYPKVFLDEFSFHPAISVPQNCLLKQDVSMISP